MRISKIAIGPAFRKFEWSEAKDRGGVECKSLKSAEEPLEGFGKAVRGLAGGVAKVMGMPKDYGQHLEIQSVILSQNKKGDELVKVAARRIYNGDGRPFKKRPRTMYVSLAIPPLLGTVYGTELEDLKKQAELFISGERLQGELPLDKPAAPSKEEVSLFEKAKDVIGETGRASTSMLQRRLKIPYTAAAEIMDALEKAGVIGPPKSNGDARDVLPQPTSGAAVPPAEAAEGPAAGASGEAPGKRKSSRGRSAA